MISISNKNVSLITKIGFVVLVLYIIGFISYKAAAYYQTSYKKELLTKELQEKRNETSSLKRKVVKTKKKIEKTKTKYITKDELEIKIKDIFKRYSVLDYDLKYLDSKMMCIDRFVLVTQLVANSEKGLKAGEGILSYIGDVKISDSNETIYFVDYVTKAKK